MSEKIKELAEQCYYINTYTDREMFNEKKFAELIVQECVEAARTVGGSAGVEMENIIRNRFGLYE
jgi:hypothetical protein